MALLCLLLQSQEKGQLLFQRDSSLCQQESKGEQKQLTARQSDMPKIMKQSVAQGGM